ncbi:putative J domain-containing protein C17A3.05c [Choanephora cucurbitarum]|uniref:Putative J domain-containing protein C17A3.05c n=1 Tax=Choanephora cucurbitarum TaxID=101091 RepID=A0A1C7NMN2_9FUNG|nr:putative J domain-containing protein C17A3.05c [Choanephora cucurbitarum]
MEINKEEALRCLSIAKNQYGTRNYEAAVRLTKKSLKLYPTDEAESFLLKAEKAATENTNVPPSPSEKSTSSNTTDASNEKPPQNASSGQQTKEVREILSCGTDYYKVLKLDKGCTEVEIKKSYRKLALKFHPDKNKTPGADEAFKLISKAFTVLSDPQKRAIHDAGGGDPEQRGAGGHPGFSGFRTQSYGASPFGEEISPEDLFNMFFGGGGAGIHMDNLHRQGFSFGGSPGFSSATFVGPGFRARTFNTQQQQQQFYQAHQRQGSGLSILLQLLPLIVLFGYTVFAGLVSENTPIFSFQSTSVHSQPRMTSSHGVPYYVNPNSFKPYLQNQYKLSKVEQQVEVDWVRSLQQNCLHERKQQQTRLNNARGAFGFIGRNEKQYQEALNMRLASCEELKRFGSRY